MQIKINTTPAILDWRVTHAKLETPSMPELTMDLDIQEPKLSIKTTRPQLKIDQSQPFAEAGLKNQEHFMADIKQISKQMHSQGVARIVSQGNEMMNIQSGADAVVEQASYNAYEMFDKEFNIGFIPQSKPDIQVIEGDVEIEVEPGKVNNNAFGNNIKKGDFTPGKIERFMKQYHSVDIQFVKDRFDKTI